MDKTEKYEHFLNEVLRNDLKRVHHLKDRITQRLADCRLVTAAITAMERKMLVSGDKAKVMTDLGSNFYVQCIVDDPNTLYVSLGLDIVLQMTTVEARDFIARREGLLSAEEKRLCEELAKIKANIKLVMQSIASLNALQ